MGHDDMEVDGDIANELPLPDADLELDPGTVSGGEHVGSDGEEGAG